jgi:hypothetical protein
VDDALLRPDPAQLAVADEVAPEGTHVLEQRVGRTADDQRSKRADGRDDDFGATPDREREPMALEAVARVGADDDVRG